MHRVNFVLAFYSLAKCEKKTTQLTRPTWLKPGGMLVAGCMDAWGWCGGVCCGGGGGNWIMIINREATTPHNTTQPTQKDGGDQAHTGFFLRAGWRFVCELFVRGTRVAYIHRYYTNHICHIISLSSVLRGKSFDSTDTNAKKTVVECALSILYFCFYESESV